jgi:hypothetical protein
MEIERQKVGKQVGMARRAVRALSKYHFVPKIVLVYAIACQRLPTVGHEWTRMSHTPLPKDRLAIRNQFAPANCEKCEITRQFG